jgi:hypothetical protein
LDNNLKCTTHPYTFEEFDALPTSALGEKSGIGYFKNPKDFGLRKLKHGD